MLGQAVYGKGKSGVVLRDGLRVYRIYLKKGGFLAPFWRKKGWKTLQKRGIRVALFPDELREEAAQFGIRPLSVAPLRRAVLGKLIGRGRCAVLRADGVDGDVEKAAALLCRRYRYVVLEVGRGQEALAGLLYRRFGVARGGAETPEITVTFRPEHLSERAIYLGEGCEKQQMLTYQVAGREGETIPEEWLCALFLAGMVQKEDISAKTISQDA